MLILTKEYEAPLTTLTARTTPSVTPKRIVWYAVLDAIGQNPTTSPMRNGDKLENSSGPGSRPPAYLTCPWCPAQSYPISTVKGLTLYLCPARHKFFVEVDDGPTLRDTTVPNS